MNSQHTITDLAEIIIDHAALGKPADRFGDVNGDGLADLAFVRRNNTTVTIVLGNATANGLLNTDSSKGPVASPWPRNWDQAFVDSQLVALTGSIENASTNPPGQDIQINSTSHGLVDGDTVTISGVNGNTAANGAWTITWVNDDNFTLNQSIANGSYTTGGQWQETITSHVIEIADDEISPSANISLQFFNMDGDGF